VAKQQLHGPQVFRPPVDERRLGSPHRVRAVACRVKTEFLDPVFKDSGVLPGSQVGRVVNAARKHKVVRLQFCLLDPLLYSVSGRRRDLELHRALGLVLHDHRARCHLVAVADVPHLQTDQVAAAELAVDSQVEECQLAHPVLHLEAHSERPDVLELERRLLADDLALVPWLAMNSVGFGSHDGLPSS